MAFVVDLGSFETQCGFSDDHSPSYTHRSVAGCSTFAADDASEPRILQCSYGSANLDWHYSQQCRAAADSSSPQQGSDAAFEAFSGLWSPPLVSSAAMMTDSAAREALVGHIGHLYHEMTNATASIAFTPSTCGRRGGPGTDAPLLPFHFVAPEGLFAGPERKGLVDFASIVLESAVCPAFYASRPCVMATLASGRASGIVLDAGHSQSHATVVVDGVAVQGSQQSTSVGGAAVNAKLLELLFTEARLPKEQLLAHCFGASVDHPLSAVRLENLCHSIKTRGGSFIDCPTLPPAGGGAQKASADGVVPMYVAPDGQIVSMPLNARSAMHEVLFSQQQQGGGGEETNLGRLVTEARLQTSLPELQSNLPLLVCGGLAGVGGFQNRLLYELKRHDLTLTDACQLKNAAPLIAPLHSHSHLQWNGAALATCSSAFAGLWITREEFEEEGSSVLHRKLFQ